jgi:hypothetical protein
MVSSYFAAYEVTKKALTPAGGNPGDLNLGAVIVAGGTAGVAMWAIAIPPDVSSPFQSVQPKTTDLINAFPGSQITTAIRT